MKLLLIGRNGQVGSALLSTLAPLGELSAFDRTRVDLTSEASIRMAVREVRPQVIVNAAAYTAVDRAEQEEALALRVNRDGPSILAEEALRCEALLVHYSTDYVFDGEKPSPYVETDSANPLNVYGRSKLAGEEAIRRSGCRYLIFRTSWIYAATGKNFLLTMLRLARQGKPLRVVDDQTGAPTSARMIAAATAQALENLGESGLFHMTAAGSTTWCGFARAIFREAGVNATVTPIASADYAAPARRPRNSMLETSLLASRGISLPSWESGLREVVSTLGEP